ncbi:DMT family transporter [Actinophytocola sp.]|uniref:DMT family transporter n=1 Tax=Actinophytocola sp. TaxID=1872138 RepID=UPI003D6A63BC
MSQQTGQRWALVAVGVTMLLWASAFVGIRAAAPHFTSGALALGRLLTASVVLVAILLLRREGLPPRAAWPAIMGAGVLWFGIYMVALNQGEQGVDAGTAAMIIGVAPILVALLSGPVLGEQISRFLLIGLAVAVGGTVLIGLSVSGSADDSLGGVLLCLLAAAASAGGVILQKPALRKASAAQVTTFGCVVGAVACLPFTGQLVTQLGEAEPSAILNMVYLGVFPTALAFSTWAYALARTPASVMGITTFLVPALAVVMSWVVLGEVAGWLAIGGGVLCLAGVGISRMRARPPAAATPEPATLAASVSPSENPRAEPR